MAGEQEGAQPLAPDRHRRGQAAPASAGREQLVELDVAGEGPSQRPLEQGLQPRKLAGVSQHPREVGQRRTLLRPAGVELDQAALSRAVLAGVGLRGSQGQLQRRIVGVVLDGAGQHPRRLDGLALGAKALGPQLPTGARAGVEAQRIGAGLLGDGGRPPGQGLLRLAKPRASLSPAKLVHRSRLPDRGEAPPRSWSSLVIAGTSPGQPAALPCGSGPGSSAPAAQPRQLSPERGAHRARDEFAAARRATACWAR